MLVAVAASWWLLWGQDHFFPATDTTVTSTKQKPAENVASTVQTDPQWALFTNPKTGEKWLPERKKVAPQGWLLREDNSEYYEVGSRAGNTIYLVFAPEYGLAGWWFMVEKTPNGAVSYIAQPQTTADYSQDRPYDFKSEALSPKVAQVDMSTHYDSLSVPNYIVLERGEKAEKPQGLSLSSYGPASGEGTVKTKVLDAASSSLYRVEKKFVDTKLTAISYELHLPIGTSVLMQYNPNKLNLEGYTWNNDAVSTTKDYSGKMVYDELKSIASGCGGLTVAVTRSDVLTRAELVTVGKTSTGRTVYEPKDKNHQLYTKAYEEYVEFTKVDSRAAVSKDEFVRQHALVVIENTKKELLVYSRAQYAPQYGCAKPVVYLYPTKQMAVNVRVGADVKLSEPLYPRGGWTVLAEPSGRLMYQGQTYSSLFWEGPGVGDYPAVHSGTVVKRSEAETTMRRQLSEQGLNTQEVADFMDYWTDRIPDKPYVRVTWFNTAQMNRLVPLYISPKPTTVQRIFLDMAGYDTKPNLPPQKLHGFVRDGFTVVEWGGLAQLQ